MEGKLFFNRELSLLAFHKRVLSLASKSSLPVMERLRYLCISATNVDELFEVRVGGLIEIIERGNGNSVMSDGLTAVETKQMVSNEAHAFVDRQYDILNTELIPALSQHGLHILKRDQWDDEHKRYLKHLFMTDVLPLLSPIGLDPAHPFPRILNKSLNLLIWTLISITLLQQFYKSYQKVEDRLKLKKLKFIKV